MEQGALSIRLAVSASMKGARLQPSECQTTDAEEKPREELMRKVWPMRIKGVVCGHRLVERSLIWLLRALCIGCAKHGPLKNLEILKEFTDDRSLVGFFHPTTGNTYDYLGPAK